MAAGTVGRVVQVLGAVVDCEFPPDQMPGIFNALEIRREAAPGRRRTGQRRRAAAARGQRRGGRRRGARRRRPARPARHRHRELGPGHAERAPGAGGGAAHRQQLGALRGDGHHGRHPPGHGRPSTPGGPITVPVGPVTLGRLFNVTGDADRRPGAGRGGQDLPHPPPPALVRGPGDPDGAVRDRDQGDRPDRPLHQGRQDRHLRRRRRGQDGDHQGADQQRRPAVRGLLRLLRRGRAHPRGQRPLQRVQGIGRPARTPCWSSGR